MSQEEQDLSKMVGGAGRGSKVKNKDIAPIQISAEQLIKESTSSADPLKTTEEARRKLRAKVDKASGTEEALQRNREFFENKIRRERHQLGVWVRYALWEESQGGPESGPRARSIFERSLDVSPYHAPLWIAYADFELRGKRLNLARNIMDRSVTLLPRLDKLWYKYLLVEEACSSDISVQRLIWERWMRWEPDVQPMLSYIAWEKRHKNDVDDDTNTKNKKCSKRILRIHQIILKVHPKNPISYLKFVEFLEMEADYASAREIFKLSFNELPITSSLLIAFAKFELRRGELERVRIIYEWGLSRLPSSSSLLHSFAQFERLNPSDSSKCLDISRSSMWSQRLSKASGDDLLDVYFTMLDEEEDLYFDNCFDDHFDDGINSENQNQNQNQNKEWQKQKILKIYKDAISSSTPLKIAENPSKKYIYIWLRYFIFLEEDPSLPNEHDKLLKLLEDRQIFSAKVIRSVAEYWLRRKDIARARSLWGRTIGLIKSSKRPEKVTRILEDYISVEMELEEWDRVRTLMEIRVSASPQRSLFWIEWAHLEHVLLDDERSVFIWEAAIASSSLDRPEEVWNSYLEQLISCHSWTAASSLYKRMMERSSKGGHLSEIIINHSRMFFDAGMSVEGRHVMEDALHSRKLDSFERKQLIEAWKDLDPNYDFSAFVPGFDGDFAIGNDSNDDDYNSSEGENNELLQLAKQWKKNSE